jgi:hypothetical protein
MGLDVEQYTSNDYKNADAVALWAESFFLGLHNGGSERWTINGVDYNYLEYAIDRIEYYIQFNNDEIFARIMALYNELTADNSLKCLTK